MVMTVSAHRTPPPQLLQAVVTVSNELSSTTYYRTIVYVLLKVILVLPVTVESVHALWLGLRLGLGNSRE